MKNKKLIFSSLMLATLLALGTTAIASSSLPEDEPAYVYLTYASPDPAHTINVSWRTNENYVGKIHYDTESKGDISGAYGYSVEGTGGVTTSKFEGYIHHVELTGLEPDTTYYFICGSSDYGWSEELSFRTAPTERKVVRFVACGDTRWDPRFPYPEWPKARNEISKLMASYDPDFVIFLGDFIWSGEYEENDLFGYTLKNYPDTWDNWFEGVFKYWRTGDGRLIPMITAIGNHEITYPEPSDYDPEIDASNYYMLFNLPGNERWYSLDWGPDLHIVILDSEIMNPRSESWDEQLGWLRQDLLEHGDCLWKIVGTQRPVFSSMRNLFNIREYWVPEFDLFHLDLYFNGDVHDYERTHPINLYLSEENYQPSPENGTIYVTSGGWGAPLGGGSPRWWTAYGPDLRYHFTLIDTYENGTLYLRAVDLNNEVFDSLIIQKGVQPQPEKRGEAPVLPVTAAVVVIVCAIIIFLYLRR